MLFIFQYAQRKTENINKEFQIVIRPIFQRSNPYIWEVLIHTYIYISHRILWSSSFDTNLVLRIPESNARLAAGYPEIYHEIMQIHQAKAGKVLSKSSPRAPCTSSSLSFTTTDQFIASLIKVEKAFIK